MLNQLLIFTNSNWYEDELEMARTYTIPEGVDFLVYGNDHVRAFEKKNYQSVVLMAVSIDTNKGEVSILYNRLYKHPMKEYIEINKEAKKDRKISMPTPPEYEEEYLEEQDD